MIAATTAAAPATRPGRRASLTAFIVLIAYAAIRWASLLGGEGQRRLYGITAIAILLAIGVRMTNRLARPAVRHAAVGVGTLAGVAATLLVAGIPADWLYTGRLDRIVSELSGGASTLPNVLLPYIGSRPDTLLVIVVGGGALMLCAALAFGSARHGTATAQLAVSAVMLVAVAAVPSAIDRPHAALVHGVVTFVLVSALVLSPRVRAERGPGAIGLVLVATVLGLAGAHLIDNHGAWITSDAIHVSGQNGNGGKPGAIEAFDWRQGYGALGPRTGETVLTISAQRRAYWKAEDLDEFNGRVWEQGVSSANGLIGVSANRLHADTETIKVTVGQMTTTNVISGGYALTPQLDGAIPGNDPGIWRAQYPLQPLDTYSVTAYVPDPSPAALRATGWSATHYSPSFAPLARVRLPARVYAPVIALAARLARGQSSAYGYMQAAIAYLRAHETYTLTPTNGGSYPIAAFLDHTHSGYCQQFAGALALLMRLRGIPTRVAVGFLPGRHQFASNNYYVADRDAHAWDEVFFPGYGWVTADPTPATTVGTSGSGPPSRPGRSPGTAPTRWSPRARPRVLTSPPAPAAPRPLGTVTAQAPRRGPGSPSAPCS